MRAMRQQIRDHIQSGSWRMLEATARALVDRASAAAHAEFRPVLGGGTRLMLAIEHRISRDIDLFHHDVQWIGYLTPRLTDDYSNGLSSYDEKSSSLKLAFPQGEVDFVWCSSLLGLPLESSPLTGFDLEAPAEVLAKKLFYRGAVLTQRDLFDWWSLSNSGIIKPHMAALSRLLQSKTDEIENSLVNMTGNRSASTHWDNLIACEKPSIEEAIEWARSALAEFSCHLPALDGKKNGARPKP